MLRGQAGSDVFESRNGFRDLLNGGPGRDRARIDGELDVFRAIEAIVRDTTNLRAGNAVGGGSRPLSAERIAAVCRGVTGTTSPPTAAPGRATTPEDTPVSLGLVGRSPFSTTLTFALAQPQHGSAALSGPVSCATAPSPEGLTACSVTARYTPSQDFFGADRFNFSVDSREGESAPGPVTLDVSEVNDPPVTASDQAGGIQDKTLEIPAAYVLANDSPGPANESAQQLAVQSVGTQGDSHGSAALVGNKITYSPDAGYFGPATITYVACDNGTTAGRADPKCSPGTISIGLAANKAPVAVERDVTTPEDTPLAVTLTGQDADGDALSFTVTGNPAHGTLGGTAPNLTYTPAKDFYGADSLTFTASDGKVVSPAATLRITVTEVNDLPAAEDDDFTVGVSEETVIAPVFVVWNDLAGPDNEAGQELEIGGVAETPESHGDVSLRDGAIVYRPDDGFKGTATIRYTLCDKGTTNGQLDPKCDTEGSVKLFVTPPDRAPVANPQQLTTAEDTDRPLTLTATDPDGDPLTFRIVEQPDHGSLVGTAPQLKYVPAADYFGPDEFKFVADDGLLESVPAAIELTVTEVNDPPVLGLDNFTVGGARELPPLPPMPHCPVPCGSVFGDPHVHTYDHGHYAFQAVGEFIVAKSTTDDFEVQVRTKGVLDTREVSLPVAVAMRVGGNRISMYRTLTGYDAFIDGVKTEIPAFPVPLAGGVTIGTYGSDYQVFVVAPDGSVVEVSAVGLFDWSYRFSVEVGLAAGRLTHMVGLLGSGDGERENDLVTRGGQQIAFPEYPAVPDFDDLYQLFGHSWRISQAESLFDYGPGQTTDTFTDRTYPDRPLYPEDLPDDVRASASSQCALFGVTDPPTLASCIVDVGATGDPEFATSSAAAQEATLGIPDNTGVTSLGEATTVAVTTAGSRAVRAFTAVAGQKVTLSITGNTIPLVDITVRRPDGSFLTNLTVSSETGFLDTFTLPVDGTFTISVDPRDDGVGSLTLSLDPVPENTGTATIGVPTTVMIGTVGESAVRSFSAEAGQLVTLAVSGNTIPIADLTVRRPDGSFLTSLTATAASGFLDTFTLPVAGTYTITVDPREQHTGMLTFALNSVPENTGTTAIGTPTTVTIGTVGEDAVRTFDAEAGQMVTLAVSGNTIPIVDLTVLEPDGSFVTNLTVSTETGFHDTFTLPVAGTYKVAIDPREQGTGAVTFSLNSVPENTGTTSIGQATPITIGTIGENAVRTFAAEAGQKVTLSVTGNTIPIVDLTVREPDGTFVGNLVVSGATGFHEPMTLDVAGTYTITIDPRQQGTGALTFTLGLVPPSSGETSIGTPTPVTITTPGENSEWTFPATAGRLVTLTVTGNTIPGVDLNVHRPNGTFLTSLFLSAATGFRDTFELPVDGTYKVIVDPRTTNVGSLTFTIGGVPQNTGDTALDQATPITIGTAGENAVRSFAATAGQLATITVTGNTIPGVDLSIRRPNGTFVGSLFLSGANGFRDVLTLDVDGTYTITVDPSGQNTGGLTFTIGAVPVNTGATALDQATPITIGTAGENAVRSFTATAGQVVTLSVTGNTIAGVDLSIRRPAGTFVGSLFLSGASGFRDVMTLDVAGTYTITVDPSAQNTGSLTFTIGTVPENTGATALGQATPITIGTPGENAIRTFAGTAGQPVTLRVTDNTVPSVNLTIRQPNGIVVGSLGVSGATGFRDVMTLPVDGTYSITVDPSGANTGSLSFTLYAVPANTGTATLGASTSVTIGTPGENAVRSFTAPAGQLVTLAVSGNTIPGADLEVRAPDNSLVDDLFVFGATASTSVMTLPVAGTYTVTIDPVGANLGSLTFTLVVPDDEGEISFGVPTTVTIDTPDATAVRSFDATAGQRVSLSVSANTIPDAQVQVRDPGGASVGSWFVAGPSDFGDVITLPVAGTYTLTVDPFDNGTGAMTLTLHAVPENTGATSIGVATPVTIGTPGENAVRSFAGAAGQRLVISASSNTIPGAQLVVREPNGSFVDSLFVFQATGFGEAMTLPVSGTYTLTVDPTGEGTGGLTFTIQTVPENTGTTSIGAATPIVIATPGEEAVRSFTGAADQRLTLSVSDNTITGAEVDVREPNGDFVRSWFVSQPTDFGDVITLPAAGTYTITVNPTAEKTGSLTYTLQVPPENTGVTSIGLATPITIGTPGENAVRSFDATAGQQVTLSVTGNTVPGVDLEVREPDGSFVDALFVFGPTATSDVMTLPAAGTYTVTVDPFGAGTGNLTFTLNAVTGGAERRQHISASVEGRRLTAESSTAIGLAKLVLTAAEVLANDRPGPANESNQTLTLTDVGTSAASHGTAVLADQKITYTPVDGYAGPAEITYTACDNGTTNGSPDPLCSDGEISFEVTTNNPPTADPKQLSTQEDTAVGVTLSGADADGDTLAFDIIEAPDHGTLSGVAPALTYTPAQNFHGTDSFRYATNDTQDRSAPVTVDITISEVNDVPSAQPNSVTNGVGRTTSVSTPTLLANDSPGPANEGDQTLALTAVTATPDTHGTVTLADGAVTYVPDAGFTGTAKVSYTACDNGTTDGQPDSRCADGLLSVAPNLAPTAATQAASTQRNTPVTITLAGSDPENDVLTFAIASAPEHGTLTGTGDTRVYTPDDGFSGSDSFTFTAADAFTASAPATVAINVVATRPPVIRPDAAATQTNTSVLIDVLANDEALDGSLDPATLSVLGPPTNGTAVVEAAKIRYTPAAGVEPNDAFTYRVCDTFGVCASAQVTVSTVVPNRPPVAVADNYTMDVNTTFEPAKPGVLGNDSDPDPGDAIQARLDTGVSAGNLLLRSDGSFRYTPSEDFAGLDSFTYHVVDRDGLASAPVTVKIEVVPLGPAAIDDEYTTTKNNALIVMPKGVLANDRDAHTTDILTASLNRETFRGTIDLNPDGSFTYIPETDFVGTDSFRYIATDVRGVPSFVAFVEIKVLESAGPVPTVGGATPADGTRVCAPTPVTANLAAPAGQTIDKWSVTARNVDRGTPVVLASGTGPPPSPLTTFDPTTLINGLYQILIAVESSGGGKTTAVTTVVVCGDMKLGDYKTTYLDLDTLIHRFPVQVLRTYDSTDKRLGDFGIGWQLELSSYRATPNNRLGQGGWSTEPFGFPFTRFRFRTTIPHFVTVTAPNGKVEIFDLVPAPTGPLLSLTTPEFVARAGTGTTSTLEDLDPPTLSTTGTGGSLASFFAGEIYDPRLFRLTTRDGFALIIDRFDGLQSITDPGGNKLIVADDGVRSPSTGHQLTFTRDGAGRITEVRGPGGQRTKYEYSKTNDLVGVTYPNDATQAFKYDTRHNLLVSSGAGQVVRTMHYDSSGRLTAITDGNGNTLQISNDVSGRQQVFTDATGKLTTVATYDDSGNQVQQDRLAGGRKITTKATYDADARPLTITDGLGRTEVMTYDAAGNVLTRKNKGGHTTTYTYNAFGQPLTIRDPLGNVTTNTFNVKGELVETEAPDGGKTKYTYDSFGNVLTKTDPVNRVTTYTYDGNGRLSSITDASGTTLIGFDTNTAEVSSIVDPTGATTTLEYDGVGNIVKVTDAKGRTRRATYDAFDRLTSVTDPTGETARQNYDAVGNLVSYTDRDGRASAFTYDAVSRLTSKTVPGAGTTTYTYDGFGRRISLQNPTARLTLTYDDADQVLSETSTPTTPGALPTTTFTYTYDGNGNVTKVQGPGGTKEYGYDAASQLTRVTDPAGGFLELGYDDVGRVTSLERPNGVDDALTYNLAGNLVSLRSTHGATLVNQADYTYNASGLRATLTTQDGTANFGYDAAKRLTSASFPAATGLANEQYTYDSLGNRTSTADTPLGSFTYDNASRLLGDGNATYQYDKEGNLVSRTITATGATTQYTWNAQHELVGITHPNSSTTAFRYDPSGRRVEVDHGASTRRYAYDMKAIAAEYDGTNALVASYVHDPRSPTSTFEMTRGGERYFYLTDALRSTRALTTSTGATANTYTYGAFGTALQTGSVANPFTFTGQVFDPPTGLHLFPLRAYDATGGRFLSEDPVPATNLYPYVANNPTNFIDPTGATLTEDTAVRKGSGDVTVAAGRTSHDAFRLGSRNWHRCIGYVVGLAAEALGGLSGLHMVAAHDVAQRLCANFRPW